MQQSPSILQHGEQTYAVGEQFVGVALSTATLRRIVVRVSAVHEQRGAVRLHHAVQEPRVELRTAAPQKRPVIKHT